MELKLLLIIAVLFNLTNGYLEPITVSNTTVITQGFLEIIRSLPTNTMILFEPSQLQTASIFPTSEFLQTANAAGLQTYVFTDVDEYVQHLQDCQLRSEITTTLIVARPEDLLSEVSILISI